jgi:hypothetical protein
MPGLFVDTETLGAPAPSRGMAAPTRRASTTSRPSRPSSPLRPPISPITPTLAPRQLPGAGRADTDTTTHHAPDDFALGRPIFTHTCQTDQVGIAPPPAQPIDFESNPDVLALKSAISILQLQRARATADIQTLSRAKEAALADPEAFAADLEAGRVRMQGDPLLSGTRINGVAEGDSEFDSSSSEDEGEEVEEGLEPESMDTSDASPQPRSRKPKTRQNGTQKDAQPQPPPWQTLPKPQTIVRCPPINWAQYGVVGESLDKLHAEQLAAPTPGAPTVLGPGGTYEPSAAGRGEVDQAGGAVGSEQQPRRLVGVAAPYNPLRDKVEKKGKGGRR